MTGSGENMQLHVSTTQSHAGIVAVHSAFGVHTVLDRIKWTIFLKRLVNKKCTKNTHSTE